MIKAMWTRSLFQTMALILLVTMRGDKKPTCWAELNGVGCYWPDDDDGRRSSCFRRFLFPTISEMAGLPSWQSLAASTHDVFLSLLSQQLSSFHLMEALRSSSLANLNCQHHSSCTLGHYRAKERLLEHKHCDTTGGHLVTERAAK